MFRRAASFFERRYSMGNEEILREFSDLFEIRSIPAWIFRYVEQFFFKLLYGLANGMETMVNHLASILAFFNQPEVQDFYQYLALASFVFLASALMFRVTILFSGKEKPFLIYAVIRCWEFYSLSPFHGRRPNFLPSEKPVARL